MQHNLALMRKICKVMADYPLACIIRNYAK